VLGREYKRKNTGKQCKDLGNGGGENGVWTGRLNQMMYRKDKTWRREEDLDFVLGIGLFETHRRSPSFSSIAKHT